MPQHQFTASYYMRIKRININRHGESLRNIEEYERKYIFKSSYRKTVIE